MAKYIKIWQTCQQKDVKGDAQSVPCGAWKAVPSNKTAQRVHDAKLHVANHTGLKTPQNQPFFGRMTT